eukprot:6385700-Prymnesium_polylepis.1
MSSVIRGAPQPADGDVAAFGKWILHTLNHGIVQRVLLRGDQVTRSSYSRAGGGPPKGHAEEPTKGAADLARIHMEVRLDGFIKPGLLHGGEADSFQVLVCELRAMRM